jgi:hypothetical protein
MLRAAKAICEYRQAGSQPAAVGSVTNTVKSCSALAALSGILLLLQSHWLFWVIAQPVVMIS